jgi:hypothetical protein
MQDQTELPQHEGVRDIYLEYLERPALGQPKLTDVRRPVASRMLNSSISPA